MINPELITQLGKQIYDLLPTPVKATQKELEKNIRAVLQAGFANLDLVNRDEFDAQVAVLERTRNTLKTLQKELDALKKDSPKSTTASS